MKWTDKLRHGKDGSQMKTRTLWSGVKRALQTSSGGLKGVGNAVGRTNVTRSVGLKLFLIIFSSILVCVLSIGLYSYSVSKDIIKKKVSQASQETITQAASKLDLMFANYEALTMQILVDNNLQSLALDLSRGGLDDYEQFKSLEEIDRLFQSFLLSNSRTIYGGAMLPLADYLQPITSGNSQLNAGEVKETDWYKKAIESKERPYWIPTQLTGLNGKQAKPTFGLTRLIKSINTGDPLYLLVLEFDYRVLSEQVGNISLGKNSDLYIVNPNGDTLYAMEQSEIGRKMDMLPVNKPSGSFTTNHKEKQSLGVYQQFDQLDWRLMGMIPVDTLVEDAKEIRNLTWITAIFAGLLAIGIGYVVIRMIAVPLGQLRNLMNEGEKGNLSVRSSIRKHDEIGQLAQSFNQMMEQITSLVDQTNRSAQEVLHTAADLSDASKKTAVSAKEIAVATEEIANGATSLAVEAEKGSDLTENMGARMTNVNEAGGQMAYSASEVE
ncbi:chemotaxis protein, partial [Paenibacillus darwinianus]